MTIPLYEGILYGPVNSRRFGRSLGINLLPANRKVCSLDCCYCQLGFAKAVNRADASTKLPRFEEIREACDREFARLNAEKLSLNDITVAGNGEPTLHPEFLAISRYLKEARDRFWPQAKLSLLSDAMHLDKADVREALACYDSPALKFEWGLPDTFARMNGVKSSYFEKIVSGIRQVKTPYIIQSLFVDGPISNTSQEEIDQWISYLKSFSPRSIQVYSLDRPPADSRLKPVSKNNLQEIANRVTRETGHATEVFWREGVWSQEDGWLSDPLSVKKASV